MPAQNYDREKNSIRFDLIGGLNTMLPPDILQQGYPYLQNVRRNLAGRTVSRPALGPNVLAATILPPHSMIRMIDPYMGVPPFPNPESVLIIGTLSGSMGQLNVNEVALVNQLTGLPLSFLIYRPNASPQPWCYTFDAAMSVSIPGYPASIYNNPIAGMFKVRSDKTIYKTGIAEPQIAPVVGIVGGLGPNWTMYRYIYRSSITGAKSNPSPESAALVMVQSSTPVVTIPAIDSRVFFNPTQWDPSAPPQLRTINEVSGQVTDYVIATGFGLSVPAGVPIQGIRVTLKWNGQSPGTGALYAVSLFYQGNILGATKNPFILNQQVSTGVNTFAGGISDDWGAGALLSAGVVNDSSFGFGVQIQEFNVGGISRSFIQNVSIQVFYADQNATITATASPDPQADKIDFFRSSPGLENFTYVGTIANASAGTGLVDTLPDLSALANPTAEFDNFEPFPSIDLPHSGTCTVTAVNQHVTAIDISSEGTGQTDGTHPITAVNAAGDTTGAGAVVTITISGGIIVNAVITAPGANYTADPTFPVVAGGTPGILAAGISPVLPLTPNVAWTSGDKFNVRWLPGTTILLGGYPGISQQTAWTLYNRPPDVNHLTAYQSTIDPITGLPAHIFPAPGTGLSFDISAATLAAQASPVVWGPTAETQGSQASFYFGLDPLNPGDLLWSKGNNFDSAPDTNRVAVSSPSEMLMNGVVTSEINAVFSTERFWLIYPNFADAIALVTGTEGSQWTLIQAQATRGLYMRYAIAALGSTIAYRAKDCIAVSQGGGPEQSITDDIYNLFPHGGSNPQPVDLVGNIIYPPDDTNPGAQTIAITPSYIFYNYQDTTGTPRTLVYDQQSKGWSVDVYNPTVNCHLYAVGSPSQLLAGCTDGTVRQFEQTGSVETGTSIIATRCENGGDARALKRIGDVFFQVGAANANPFTLQLYRDRYKFPVTGFAPTTLSTLSNNLFPHIVDFSSGLGSDLVDIAAILSWPLGTRNIADQWQPDWVPLPETIQSRPTDWSECGIPGNKLIRGFIVEMDTFNAAKQLLVESSDDGVQHFPAQPPVTVNGQTLVPFTFRPPFVGHMMRIISVDGVPWRMWGADAVWIVDPWPDYSSLYSAWSDLGAAGAKYIRSMLLPMDTNGALGSFIVQTSDGDAINFGFTTPPAVKTPVAFEFRPPIIAHEVQIQCLSPAALWTEEVKWFFDPYPELVAALTPIMEIGGSGFKYMRGIKIVGDSGGGAVQFQIHYDGGQLGPLLGAAFNGKQTVPFAFDPPFLAHDVQLVPLDGMRIWMPGMGGEDVSEWIYDPWPDYTPLYSAWLNLGQDGAKYLRSMVIPMDTNGAVGTFVVLTSDGNSVTFTATTTPAVKTPVAFAFNPPIVVHEVQLQCQTNTALWSEEVKWFFDPYPELIPAYTPVMEISGPDNKFMQGIKIVGDTSFTLVGDVDPQPVQFQILYDGQQIGPLLEPRYFNGKQTQVYSFNPPFNAHDVQLVPQQPVRIWMPGMGAEDTSEWVFQPTPESATTWTTEASSLGLYGWCFIYQINLAYVSLNPVNLDVITDQGTFTLTFPPSTGPGDTPSKVLMKCPRNKWKIVSFTATSATAFSLWKDLTEVWVRSWGEAAEFHKINPFGGDSSPAATI